MYVRNNITAGIQYLHNSNIAFCRYLMKNLLCISVNDIFGNPLKVEYLTQLVLCNTHTHTQTNSTFFRSYLSRISAHYNKFMCFSCINVLFVKGCFIVSQNIYKYQNNFNVLEESQILQTKGISN